MELDVATSKELSCHFPIDSLLPGGFNVYVRPGKPPASLHISRYFLSFGQTFEQIHANSHGREKCKHKDGGEENFLFKVILSLLNASVKPNSAVRHSLFEEAWGSNKTAV